MLARLVLENGNMKICKPELTKHDDCTVVSLSKKIIGAQCVYVDFLYDYFETEVGEKGYYVMPLEAAMGTFVTYFSERNDTERLSLFSHMACYGKFDGANGELVIVEGMKYDYGLVAGKKCEKYYIYPRFYIDCDEPYEDISVKIYSIKNGNYSAMARKYREYQLTVGGCVPLAERVKADARLYKSASSICVRVRQGWKPAPSAVIDQTPETEPEMHVACTFERVGDIAGEFSKQGIKNAEFCLVGWNYRGHDGRFPQIFPVEPALGGEEELKKLIDKIHKYNFGVVCHDDATAAYKIADCWDEEYILKNKDGSLYERPTVWSGGRPYKICPRREYEKFEVPNMKKIRALGFEGIHYIDVITILNLLKCYDENHPLNRKESAEWYRKIMKLARKTFGGFSSEAGYDFAASELDYVMYTSFYLDNNSMPKICDEAIPFWQLVYHGIILYNPGTFTLNYSAKAEKNRLKYFEYGGRPLAVYYANFKAGDHWMGTEDFICDTDEQLVDSVLKIKQMAEDYEMLSPVRYAFMDYHEKLSDGVYKTTYSNGISIVVNYNEETVKIEGIK